MRLFRKKAISPPFSVTMAFNLICNNSKADSASAVNEIRDVNASVLIPTGNNRK